MNTTFNKKLSCFGFDMDFYFLKVTFLERYLFQSIILFKNCFSKELMESETLFSVEQISKEQCAAEETFSLAS